MFMQIYNIMTEISKSAIKSSNHILFCLIEWMVTLLEDVECSTVSSADI